jgi:hypothetical protein
VPSIKQRFSLTGRNCIAGRRDRNSRARPASDALASCGQRICTRRSGFGASVHSKVREPGCIRAMTESPPLIPSTRRHRPSCGAGESNRLDTLASRVEHSSSVRVILAATRPCGWPVMTTMLVPVGIAYAEASAYGYQRPLCDHRAAARVRLCSSELHPVLGSDSALAPRDPTVVLLLSAGDPHRAVARPE